MGGGQFYTVMMQQTNKNLSRRLQHGQMKQKQKLKVIHRFKQREVLFTGYVGCGKSALLKAVVGHFSLPTCSLHGNGEILMVMGVGKGKPKGSYPAKFNIIDSSGYDQQHGVVVRFLLAYRPNLRMVFLMIDASKGLQDEDRAMLEYMEGKPGMANIQPVLTKVDRIAPEERPKIAEEIFREIKKTSPWAPAPILTCSRREGQTGIEEMRRCIAKVAELSYEDAWVSHNQPRPLDDATNEPGGDAEGTADRTTRPERAEKPERRRVERAERASTEGKEERAGSDARHRLRHSVRSEERREVVREQAEAGRRPRTVVGFGMKQVARGWTDI